MAWITSASVSSNLRSPYRTQYQATCNCSVIGLLRIEVTYSVSSDTNFSVSTPISSPRVSYTPRKSVE